MSVGLIMNLMRFDYHLLPFAVLILDVDLFFFFFDRQFCLERTEHVSLDTSKRVYMCSSCSHCRARLARECRYG